MSRKPRGEEYELAIDPGYGKRAGGCACVHGVDGEITAAWFERPTEGFPITAGAWRYSRIHIEKPQQDARSYAATPAVLIELSWQGALLAGQYAGAHGAIVKAYTVNEWKGSEAKPAHHARLWAILSAGERAVLGGDATLLQIELAVERGALCRWSKPKLYPDSFVTHNLLDAACLYKWARGLLEKRG